MIEWNKYVFVVDAGPDYEDVLKPYLMMRGIKEIDGVVLSHSDWDHVEGLLALTADADFSVKRLWIPNDPVQLDENLVQLVENVQAQEGSVLEVKAGYSFYTEDFEMNVLSPVAAHTDKNEGSLVAEFAIEGWRFLFTGDIGEDTERELWQYWTDIDVLKTAHHGSRYSTTEEFLQLIEPEVAVISCGRNNRYGHPHKETIERLKKNEINYFVTAYDGAIWIEQEESQLIVNRYMAQ